MIAEEIVTMTLLELPGTRNWIPGSSRRVAHRIINDLKAQGAVITFYPAKPSVVVPSETNVAMRRLVEKDRINE